MAVPRNVARGHDDRDSGPTWARPRPRSGPPPKRPGRRRSPTRRAWRRARRRGVTAWQRRSPTCGERQACRKFPPEPARPPPAAGPRSPAQRTPDRAQRAAVQLDGVARDNQPVTAARLPGARANVESGRIRPAPRSSTQTETWLPLMRPVTVTGPRPCSTAFATRLSSACVSRIGYPVNARHPARQSSATCRDPRDSDTFQASTTRPATSSRSTNSRVRGRPGRGRHGPPRGHWRPRAHDRIRGAAPRRATARTFQERARAGTAQRRSRSARRAARGSKGDGTQAADQAAAPEDLHRGGTCRGPRRKQSDRLDHQSERSVSR